MAKVWIKQFAALCSLLLLFTMLPFVAFAEGENSSDIQTEIEQLQEQEEALLKELARLESKLTGTAEAMEEAVEQKDVLDQQIVLLYDQINNANAQITAFTQLISEKQTQLDELLADQKVLQQKHKERIRSMEERGTMSYWTIIFRSTSITDLLGRLDMISQIMEADRKSISDLRRTSTLVMVARQDLEKQRQAMEQSLDQLEIAQLELEKKRKEADKLLQDLLTKEQKYQQLIEQSEEKQDALMQQLAQKKSSYNDAAYREWLENEMQGEEPSYYDNDTWLKPLTKYTLSSPFGMRYHPVLKKDKMHNGVDMAAPANTPIYAARGGQVITAAYQKNGAGNYVQIDHGDGFRSIYMHMTRYIVKVGDYVAPGQVIGYVGSTGMSTGNHLHFGISKNGKYVNPMEYIPK